MWKFEGACEMFSFARIIICKYLFILFLVLFQKYRLHTRRTPTNNASCKDQQSTTSQQSTSQSGSPTGPLQLAIATGGTGESCDEEDERSESYGWKL